MVDSFLIEFSRNCGGETEYADCAQINSGRHHRAPPEHGIFGFAACYRHTVVLVQRPIRQAGREWEALAGRRAE